MVIGLDVGSTRRELGGPGPDGRQELPEPSPPVLAERLARRREHLVVIEHRLEVADQPLGAVKLPLPSASMEAIITSPATTPAGRLTAIEVAPLPVCAVSALRK